MTVIQVNTSRNKSQGIVVSFYHAIHATRLVQMPSKERKRSCPFSFATARCKKPKNSFSLDWAEKLAERVRALTLTRSNGMAEGVE